MFSGISSVLSTIGSVLGVNSIADAVDKIQKDDLNPEERIELAKLGIQSQALENEDKKDLRATNSNPGSHLNFTIANISANVMSLVLIVCGSFGSMEEDIKVMLVTAGTGILSLYYGYWLGSSIGSHLKNHWRPPTND